MNELIKNNVLSPEMLKGLPFGVSIAFIVGTTIIEIVNNCNVDFSFHISPATK